MVVKIVVLEEDVVAEAKAKVEIAARQSTKVLYTITAKKQDILLITARSQPQY